jgi:hypothetical protein
MLSTPQACLLMPGVVLISITPGPTYTCSPPGCPPAMLFAGTLFPPGAFASRTLSPVDVDLHRRAGAGRLAWASPARV